MKRLDTLADIEWIAKGVVQRDSSSHCTLGHHVSECIPPTFPAYVKLLHSIYEDLAVTGDDLNWQQSHEAMPPAAPTTPVPKPLIEALNKSTLVYGSAGPRARLVRIRWAELARQQGIRFVPTLSAWSFTRQFPGRSWPRRLIGPKQGALPDADRDALVSVLRPHTAVERCLFHLWPLATQQWTDDLMFEGTLEDASKFPDQVSGARLTPTHWFPEDHSWLVYTDYDLTFTLIGCTKALAGALLSSPDLECVGVTPETRVDNEADTVGTVH